MIRSVIKSVGSYLPSKVLTNKELEKLVETNSDWIVERTGIKERHIADESELTSDLAVQAANDALNNADLNPQDIDLIIVATTTPDNTFPATAVTIQQKLGIQKATAFDVQAVCAGFIFALATADSMIKNLGYKRALVIGAETISRIVDWEDRSTCILFGDGAGALILEAQENADSGILACSLHTDGNSKDILYTDGGVSTNQRSGFIKMEGKEVFKHAVTKLSDVTLESLEKAKIKPEEVNWVIPHQANQRILDGVAKKLNISEDKIISTVSKHANTSAASIPLALDSAFKAGKIKKGDILALQAIGGGLAWGSVIVRV